MNNFDKNKRFYKKIDIIEYAIISSLATLALLVLIIFGAYSALNTKYAIVNKEYINIKLDSIENSFNVLVKFEDNYLYDGQLDYDEIQRRISRDVYAISADVNGFRKKDQWVFENVDNE